MRVLNIEMLDNGFIVQTQETEQSQGMRIAANKEVVLQMVSEELDAAITALQPTIPDATQAEPVARILNAAEAANKAAGAADHAAETALQAAEAVVNAPAAAAFGSPEYVAEMNRLLAENDRKEIKRRLDAHIAAGAIEEYNKNCKAKSLLEVLYNADQKAAGAPAETPAAPAAPAAPVPPPSGVDTGITLAQVGNALSEAGQRVGQERMSEVYALITSSESVSGGAPTKVSEISPAFYQNVINQANALV